MAYDKVVDSTVLDGYFTDIADAIRDKDGTQNTYTPAQMPQAIEDIPTGGGKEVEKKDVNFYDYDGTVVASYTAAEFASLSAMPANPSHQGLTAQGWNYTLTEAKATLDAVGACDIGQHYITDDGDTRIYCHITEATRDIELRLYIKGTVDVDWGDGSEYGIISYPYSNFFTKSATHDYATAGDYTIKIKPRENCVFEFPTSSSECECFFRSSDSSRQTNAITQAYASTIYKIELGANLNTNWTSNAGGIFNGLRNLETITVPVTGSNAIWNGMKNFYTCYNLKALIIPKIVSVIKNNLMTNCYSLEIVSIPSGVQTIGNQALKGNYSLKRVVVPQTVTSLGASAFVSDATLNEIFLPPGLTATQSQLLYDCQSLTKLKIPASVTTIGSQSLAGLTSMVSITIPDGVTNIEDYAFYGNTATMEYHLLPTTPPTLGGTNAFSGMRADAVIYVPTGSLEAYQTATNWSTYASKMQEE